MERIRSLADFLAENAQDAASRERLLRTWDEALRDPQHRPLALRWLRALEDAPPEAGLRVVKAPVVTSRGTLPIRLLLVPSVFAPEAWSQTFLEGLLRLPTDMWSDADVVELGSGSGWVSIALLLLFPIRRIIGLDLNPQAELVARINLMLNSVDEEGAPLQGPNGAPLTDRFEARTSDLFSAIAPGESFDAILGCIPQVLAPDPDMDLERARTALDESTLYDLSNYCVTQGVFEDEFGLGLLARAIEASTVRLRPRGHLVLNIAGRPGAAVIDRMFARRGYRHHVLWSSRVQQAADTDIEALAKLEAKTGHPFAFMLSRRSRVPTNAATAHAAQQAGVAIWHEVRVIDARLRYPTSLQAFHQAVEALGVRNLLDQLDLSATSGEQISFLERLASTLAQSSRAPYTHERGSARLRGLIAAHLQVNHGLTLSGDEVFLAPSREALVEALAFCLAMPGDLALVSSALPEALVAPLRRTGLRVLRTNDDLEELETLVSHLRPTFVLAQLSEDEKRNRAGLARLVQTCRQVAATLVLDGSEDFEIASDPPVDPALEALRDHGPEGLMVLVGLTKGQVYPTLRPALLLGVDEGLAPGMVAFAECSYSRLGTFAERYYIHLFEDILSFRLQPSADTLQPPGRTLRALSDRARHILRWPAVGADHAGGTASEELQEGASLVRLDYGENELAMAPRLVEGVLLGFSNLASDVEDSLLAARVAEAAYGGGVSVLPAAGVVPLLRAAVGALGDALGRSPHVGIIAPYYGLLPPLIEMAGGVVKILPQEAGGDAAALARAAAELSLDVLLVTNPSNPSGVFAPSEWWDAVCAWSEETRVRLWCDEVFAELDLGEAGGEPPWLLGRALPFLPSGPLVLGGLSKGQAAGGLRFGWAASKDARFLESMRGWLSAGVERHVRVAAEWFLRDAAQRPGGLRERGGAQRALLQERRTALIGHLERLGLRVSEGRPGGLFVFAVLAEPDEPLRWSVGERVVEVSPTELAASFERALGVRVNAGAWAGVEGGVRLCFALEPGRWSTLLERLSDAERVPA